MDDLASTITWSELNLDGLGLVEKQPINAETLTQSHCEKRSFKLKLATLKNWKYKTCCLALVDHIIPYTFFHSLDVQNNKNKGGKTLKKRVYPNF